VTLIQLSLCLFLAAAPGPDAGVNAEPGAIAPPVVSVPRTTPAPESMPFNQDTIRTLVRTKQPEIERCWEQYLAGQDVKAVEGKIQTKFVITPVGSVRNATVVKKGTTVKSTELHRCVTTVLSTLTFPKPPDGKDHPVEYPFNLKAVR
jgi:hypothetical protein